MKIELEKPKRFSKEELDLLSKEDLIEIIGIKDDYIEVVADNCSELATISVNTATLLDYIQDELRREINHCENENAESHNSCHIQLNFHKRLLSEIVEKAKDIQGDNNEEDD